MNYKYLFNEFNGYTQQNKYGVETIAAIGALVVSAAGTVYASERAASTQSSINATNEENFHEALNFNREEAEKARNFQSEETEKNRDWQVSQTEQQRQYFQQTINSQRQWDSLSNQVKLAKAAGFNPSAVLAGGDSVGSGSQFGVPDIPTVSSAPSPSSPSAPSLPDLKNPDLNALSGIQSLSSLISALGTFSKDTSEGEKNRGLLEGLKELLGNQVYGTEMDNAMKSIDLAVAGKTKLQKELNNLKLQYLDGLVKVKMGKFYDSESFKDDCLAFLHQCQANLSDKQAARVFQDFQYFMTAYDKQLEVMNSEIYRNRQQGNAAGAQGAYFGSMTKTNDAIREWQVEYNKFHALVEKSRHTVLSGTEMAQMNDIVNRSVSSGFFSDEVQQRVRLLKKEGDYYELDRIMHAAGVLIGAGLVLK